MTITAKAKTVVALAEQAIEANSTEQELRRLQFELDRRLHDLRSEFYRREQDLRAEYLTAVEATMEGAAE
jgi:hypothetical protein